jgi:phenylpropionate dioxygenase-like ring-hydroxylating dioxygenase large terminal subunit
MLLFYGREASVTITRIPDEETIARRLREAWWPVALVAEVEYPARSAYPATLLDQSLVVYRGESGAFYVADRRCPHRAASLALGQVSGEAIACAYHG